MQGGRLPFFLPFIKDGVCNCDTVFVETRFLVSAKMRCSRDTGVRNGSSRLPGNGSLEDDRCLFHGDGGFVITPEPYLWHRGHLGMQMTSLSRDGK